MSELDTATAPPSAPAEEVRALADLAEIETARADNAELAELAESFERAVSEDIAQHGMLLYMAPGAMHRAALARMVRVTLRLAKDSGTRGVRLDHLKSLYQALDVPVRMAEFIERKLTADGVGRVTEGRLYFSANASTWARLAVTRAE